MVNQVDYIVVGCGLAGIAFCEILKANNKSFIVFDDASQQSSIVAAGLYNPVILKRFTPVWKANEQLKLAVPLYKKIENDLKIKVDYSLKILRRFASIEEQNLWFEAMDKKGLEPYLSSNIIQNKNKYIDAPFGFGEVLQAGRVDTNTLILSYKSHLLSHQQLISKPFEYDNVELTNNGIAYQNISAKQLVFSEGFGVKKNPFFENIPINGTKGEVLTLRIPKLKLDYAIKSSVFIIPIGNDLYNVGSTYNWKDKSNQPTKQAKNELLEKLSAFLNCEFEIVEHVAGIRPTVPDRRPIIGRHKTHKNLYILNGLGTRGVMIAPYASVALFNFVEKDMKIDAEMDVNRFFP